MSEKKISRSRPILSDDDLATNLQKVLNYSGMTQAEFAEELGIKPQAMNGYLLNRDNRKAINLYPKLVELGISGDWYLTGNGPMLVSQLEAPSPEDRHALEVGRDFIAVMKKAGEGTFKLENDSTADCRLPTAAPETETNDRPFVMPGQQRRSGPPPKFTDAEIAERFGHRPYVAPSSGE